MRTRSRASAHAPHRAAVAAAAAALVLALPLSAQQLAPRQAASGTSAASAAAATPADRLTIAGYLDLQDVRDPRLSPDGKQVVYTRRWIDQVNDRWASSLWVMNSDGSRQRFLVDGSDAVWSPDGSRIAYIAKGDPEGTQIWVKYMDGDGAASQITRLDETPANLEWAPDGKSIAFTMLVPNKDPWHIDMPAAPKGAKWTAPPRVITRLDYRADRQGWLTDGQHQIFVVSADGGIPRQVTTGPYEARGPRWMPDGKHILFTSLREPDADYHIRQSEIYSVSVDDGSVAQLTHHNGPDHDAVASPDGKLVAYLAHDSTDDTYTDDHLFVMSADGSGVRALTPSLDRTPAGLMWAPDGSGIYFNVDDQGTRNLWFAPLKGEPRQVTSGNHLLTVDDVNRSGLAIGTATSYYAPSDVVALSVRKPADIAQLTHVNDDLLHGKKLGQVEEIRIPSKDGLKIQGWIIKPPDFDPSRKYPLILTIHGGPHAMYGVGFNYAWQEHAAQNYVLLYTNPRGSTGYGSAFGNAIKNAYPGKDFDDLMAAVDTVVGRGYIDTRNMFVYGCSGGGVLTAWTVGHTDRFAAAVSQCPVIDWVSFVGTTDSPYWYYNFAKFPWDDPSEHLRRSPLMYAGHVKTPTLLMTGVLDMRTPNGQAEEFYDALKIRHVPTAMIRFNDEWHGTTSRPSNWMRTQLYVQSWFRRFATPDSTKVAAGGGGAR